MNLYRALREKQRQEILAFTIKFAFDNKQFAKGMRELGLAPTDTDKICSIQGGGFILKSEEKALCEMSVRHRKEHEEAIAKDKTGNGYIYEMFYDELYNCEYGFTTEIDEALDALDLTLEQVSDDPRMIKALNKASEKILNMRWLP